MATNLSRNASFNGRAANGGARLPAPRLSEESARMDKINNDEFERQVIVYLEPANIRPALLVESEAAQLRAGYSTGAGRLAALRGLVNPRENVFQVRLGLAPFDVPTPAQTAEADEFFRKYGTRLADQPRQAPPNPLKPTPPGTGPLKAPPPAAPEPTPPAATPPAAAAPNFAADLDIVDPATVEQPARLYPYGQWLNGDPKLAAAGGVAHTGGLILPVKYLEDDLSPAPGWARATVAFGSGKSEMVLAATKPALAVIRTRFRWFVNRGGQTEYFPRAEYKDGAGMRGHLQALCAVFGYDFPVVFTFTGKASQVFEVMLREFATKVADAAAKATRPPAGAPAAKARTFPRFAWYMKFQAGPHAKAGQRGQESIITPPESLLPALLDPTYLAKIYVGRERLLELQQVYHESAEWAAQWNSGQSVSAGEPADQGETEEPF